MKRVRVDVPVLPGASVRPDADVAHHLIRVLRVAVGDPVEVVDEAGTSWEAVVGDLAPLTLEVTGAAAGASAAPTRRLELWLPLLKGRRTDDLVRQLTELGAWTIIPFTATRSVVRPAPGRVEGQLARWRRIAEESTRQCRRGDLPVIAAPRGLPDAGPGVYFWEEARAPAREALASAAEGLAAEEALRVLVGPEGGLTVDEADALERLGWRAAWLGPRILRAETAVVVAATLAMHALGEGGY